MSVLNKLRILVWIGLFFFSSCDESENPAAPTALELTSLSVGLVTMDTDAGASNVDVPTDKSINASFNFPLDIAAVHDAFTLKRTSSGESLPLTIIFFDNNKTINATPQSTLMSNEEYILSIGNNLLGKDGEVFIGLEVKFTTIAKPLLISAIRVSSNSVDASSNVVNVPVSGQAFEIEFASPVQTESINAETVSIMQSAAVIPLNYAFSESNRKLQITPQVSLSDFTKYKLVVSDVAGLQGEKMETLEINFYTGSNSVPDFPVLSEEELLTKVQQQTFKYFWDFAHPASGMARERNTSGDVVTSGGSGFGIMAIIVAIERNFITRDEGLARMDKILTFLETADRFHGAWSHWLNGNTGDVVPFSANDNGGDLVETSFLVQGLLTFRQYLDAGVPAEQTLISRINTLWHGVEWDWYRQNQNVLYWHWSPDKQWAMNHKIIGYNEALITYVLAASSPTSTITKNVYQQGWANSGAIVNGKTFYNITLPVGFDYGGPLFFTHYSFLGLDPRNLSDEYANYWTQNVNHSKINHAYSVANPKKFVGYSDESWGLTASDNHQGYSAHSPANDLGVISPTAALSSFPYTPDESMKALKFFYYGLGDRLWGQYGFYDAFNLTEQWTASSTLAIDQGPIIIMIENYRTGLLWDLFMSAPEVRTGLDKLNFTY